MSRSARTLLRAAFLLLAALTGTYGLLAYIPFTYEAVIKFPMVSWLPGFVRIHPGLVLACLAGNLWCDRRRLARPGFLAFYLAGALLGLGLLVHPVLAAIRNAPSSYGIALASFLAPCWLLGLDLHAAGGERWRPAPAGEPSRLLLACPPEENHA